MQFNSGMTLQQYKDAMFQNAKIEVCTICKYPDVDLVLNEEEEAFITKYRFEQTGEDYKPGTSLTIDEQLQIIDIRAKNFEQYKDLEKSVEAAIAASKNIKQECYFLPWTRSVILIRKPTLDEYDNHIIDLNVIEDESKNVPARETAMKRHQMRQLYARKLVVFPSAQKLTELCQIKPDLMGNIYTTSMNLANDQMKFEVLKYKGL